MRKAARSLEWDQAAISAVVLSLAITPAAQAYAARAAAQTIRPAQNFVGAAEFRFRRAHPLFMSPHARLSQSSAKPVKQPTRRAQSSAGAAVALSGFEQTPHYRIILHGASVTLFVAIPFPVFNARREAMSL